MITADILPQPPEQKKGMPTQKTKPSGRINQSLEAFRSYLGRCGLTIRREKNTSNGTCLILSECPMHPEHGHGTDTAIVYHADGAIGFECKHNGCSGYTWQDVRKHIDQAWTGSAEHVDMTPVLMEPSDLGGHCNLTDLGNAERLAQRHGQDIRYVRGDGDSGDFFIWDGSRWVRDCQGEVMRRARETTRSIYEEVASEENDGDRRQIRKHAVKSESERSLRAMVELVTSDPMVAISSKDLDTDPWLLNCQNGTIDLRTAEFRPALREDHCTKLAPVVYDPQAACPRWDQFMGEIMNSDPELVGYLQRLAGMWLTGEINEHVFPVFYGEGQNGKNTMLDAIQAIMGDYADTAPDTLISVRSAQTHPADKAKLWSKRLIIASETDEGDKLRVLISDD